MVNGGADAVGLACAALTGAGVELLVAVPDSLLAPLIDRAAGRPGLRYVQANDEATAVGIAAGATLAGVRALVVMENSGLRRACETLSRLLLAHRLNVAFLVSHRGAFGERNWWGVAHSDTMKAHLSMLRTPFTEIESVAELRPALDAAFATLETGQCGVGVVGGRGFLSELRPAG